MKIYHSENKIIVTFAKIADIEGIALDIPAEKNAIEYITESIDNNVFVNAYCAALDNGNILDSYDCNEMTKSMTVYTLPNEITVSGMIGSEKQVIWAHDLLNDTYRYGYDRYIQSAHDGKVKKAEKFKRGCESFKKLCCAGIGGFISAHNVIEGRRVLHQVIEWMGREDLEDDFNANHYFQINAKNVAEID